MNVTDLQGQDDNDPVAPNIDPVAQFSDPALAHQFRERWEADRPGTLANNLDRRGSCIVILLVLLALLAAVAVLVVYLVR